MAPPPSPVPFEQLFAHRAWLRRLAKGLVADMASADDLEQEVWLKALRSPPRARGSLRGWLGTVLRNTARDRHRRERRRASRAPVPLPDPDASADDLAVRAETHERVTRAVLDLDEPYRSVVLLRYVGDKPVAVVAEELALPIETVRTRLRRARKQLRARLDDAHGGQRSAWLAALAPLVPASVPATTTHAAAGAGGAVLMSAKILVPLTIVVAVVGAVFWMQHDGTESDPFVADGSSEPAGDATGLSPQEAPLRGTGPTEQPSDPSAKRAQPSATADLPEASAPTFRAPEGFEAGAGRIVGRVVDVDGNPVAGAPVRVQGRIGVGSDARTYDETITTDRAGWFRLRDVPDGATQPYRIAVHLDDGRRARGRSSPGDEPGKLVVRPTVTLTGQLVGDTADTPIEGIALRLKREDAVAAEWGVVGHTGKDGVFQFADLVAGDYVLTLNRGGGDGKTPTEQLSPIRIEKIRVPHKHLEVPVRIGQVIAGVIRGPEGTPVGVPILVELLGQTAHGDTDYSRRSRRTTTDGNFRFVGLAEGRYLLTFEPRKATDDMNALPLAATKLEAVPAGSDNLIVDMHAGNAIQGYLVGPDGNEVKARGYLYIHPPGNPAGGPDAVVVYVANKSRFRSGPLDPTQAYDILVSSFEGYRDQRVKGVYPGDRDIVIKLVEAGTIKGKIQATDGSTLPGFIPLVAHAAPKHSAEPGANRAGHTSGGGAFTLDGLGPFTYRMSAGGGNSGMVSDGVVEGVAPGAEDVVLKVKKGAAFSGRLVDEEGNPVKATRMGAHGVPHVGGIDSTTSVEGEDGRFVFAGVPAGKIELWAYIGGSYVKLGTHTAPAKDVEIKVPAR